MGVYCYKLQWGGKSWGGGGVRLMKGVYIGYIMGGGYNAKMGC